MGFSNAYAKKLLDGRWQKKRLQILERDGFMCTICQRQHNVQIHHNWYLKDYEPWDYDDNQLVTLCNEHHDEVTTLQDGLKKLLARSGPAQQRQVYDFLMGLQKQEKQPKEVAKPFIEPPDGQYDAIVVSGERLGKWWLGTVLRIASGEHSGRRFKLDFGLWLPVEKDSNAAKSLFSDLCRAVGNHTPKDVSDLFNIPVIVNVYGGVVTGFSRSDLI